MKLCSKRIAATQFTLCMAISNLVLAVGIWIIGPLKEIFHWEYVILAYVPFALVKFRIFDFDKHQKRMEELKTKMVDS